MAFLTLKTRYISSWGGLSLAALQVALLSGLFLIPLFEPGTGAFEFYSRLFNHSLTNCLQGIHHRASDFFLLTMIVHIWEYLDEKVFADYPRKRWYLLLLLMVFGFAAAFSGFLSVGNEESLSAGRIIAALLNDLSAAGNTLRGFFLSGISPAGGTVYYHHIATFTVFTVILTYVHIRRLQPENHDLLTAFIVILLWVCLFPGSPGFAPDTPVQEIWGPWYFMSLQQLLKILPAGLVILIFPLFVLLVFALLPEKKGRYFNAAFDLLIIIYFFFGLWAVYSLIL